jgi:MFS transporter, SP family, arabinose:H+ symporter
LLKKPVLQKIPDHNFLALVIILASFGGLLFGFDMAVISGVLPFVEKQFDLSPAQVGLFVSSALAGCVVGVAIAGTLSDRIGRKIPLFLAAVLFLLSAAGCALFTSLPWLITARVTGGLGVGIASIVVPLYISEIAPSKIRGRLVTCFQLAITVGILAAYLTNAFLLKYSNDHQGPKADNLFSFLYVKEVWRGMFSIGIVPALVFFVGLIFVPESPRWLIKKGRNAEAKLILDRIDYGKEKMDLVNDSSELTDKKGSYRELFSPRMRKALLLGILLPLFSQLSGINAIIYYGPTILTSAGVDMSNSLLSQVILGAANLIFTLIAVWKVDELGRRPLYLIGTIGAMVSLFFAGLLFYFGYTSNFLLLACVLIFLACFAFSIGPLKFVVASEIFPTSIRGRGMAVSVMVMWVADTIMGQITPILLREAGTSATFWIFSFFCLVAFFTVYKLLPETKGKSLEEIELSWSEKKSVLTKA